MVSSTIKFMLGLSPSTEAIEKKNQALLSEYTELQKFAKSENYARYIYLQEFISSKEFADKKQYYHTLVYKGSNEESQENNYITQKKSHDVKFFYKYKASSALSLFKKMDGSETILQHERLKAFIGSDQYKKVEDYMKDKKRFEKTQEFQKFQEYIAMHENQSFKNYFKFIGQKAYNDFKNLYRSTKITDFEALGKYIQSNEFASLKQSMKPKEFNASEAHRKLEENLKLKKAKDIKNYYALANSPLLSDYKKLNDSEELKFYNELKAFVTSSAYSSKKKEIESLRFENTDEYKKLQEYKKLDSSSDVKGYFKIKDSKELADFQRIEKSKLIPEFEALEQIINSSEFKNRKAYLLDSKKWLKTEEYKQYVEFQTLKKDAKITWYLKLKDSTKYDGIKAWNLVFEDDFTTGKVDRSKWITKYFWGEVLLNDTYALPGEKHLFNEEKNIQCNGSSIKLVTKKEKLSGKEWNPALGFYPKEFDFSSAIINSGSSFRTKYGKIEAKIKINPTKGVFHAFWLAGESMVPQVDIFKCDESKLYLSTFWGDPSHVNSIQKDTSTVSVGIVKGKYMIYTIEWNPQSIVWKINNQTVKVQNSNIPDSEMYIALNSGVLADDADVNNANFEVDWIKCYHKAN